MPPSGGAPRKGPAAVRGDTMRDPMRFLIAVDDSASSSQALSYAAEILPSAPDIRVVLLHALGPLPRLLADPDPTPEKRDDQAAWLLRARADAMPMLERAKEFLVAAGLDDDRIEAHSIDCPSGEFAEAILRAAGGADCGTIILGRDAISWAPQLLHRHIGERVVQGGKDLAVWLVG